jgi:hypothetical protein
LALLIVVLAVLLLIILVLVVPVEVEFFLNFNNSVNFKLRIFYLFRLISWEPLRAKVARRKRPSSRSKRRGGLKWRTFFEAIQVRGLWSSILVLLRRMVRAVKVRRLESDIKISLGEEYYTGMFIGMSIPVTLLLNSWLSSNLKIVPAFEEDLMIDGHLAGAITVRPINMLAPMTAFMFSPPALKSAWIMVRKR